MNIAFLSALQSDMGQMDARTSYGVLQAQLRLLGLEFWAVHGVYKGVYEDSFMVQYRTDHELAQVKRVAMYHKQECILVLENIRVLPDVTIASGGLEYKTTPTTGYYHGEHVEQRLTFHQSRPEEDHTQLPALFGGMYLTVKET